VKISRQNTRVADCPTSDGPPIGGSIVRKWAVSLPAAYPWMRYAQSTVTRLVRWSINSYCGCDKFSASSQLN